MNKKNTKNNRPISFSIIIPAYNEEASIHNVLEGLISILSKLNRNNFIYEIIVVNDGSSDNTESIIKKHSVKLISHHNNLGYGASLKSGIRDSIYEYIIIIDADGTYPTNKIPYLLNQLDSYDMVVGSRNINDKNIPTIRKPVKWIMGKLANYLSETHIPDLNSGLRVFKKNIALKFYKILPSGFSFTTTITLAMHCNGYNVKYIPIDYAKREGKSKFSPISDTLNFLLLILRTVIYFNPLKVFLPLSALLFLFFMIFLIKDIFLLSNLTDKTVFLFIAFIQILAIGLLADLIDKRSS